jgi:amino acid permease
VSRFLPIDFHEGEGALGFVLAVFLSWLCASFSAWILIRGTARYLKRRPNDSHYRRLLSLEAFRDSAQTVVGRTAIQVS